MASKSTSSNALITTRAPEAALSVQLHPLVLLTITDYITRHTSRQQSAPIIGAIIGQQSGRNFTLEHAYECKTIPPPEGGIALDKQWFEERLEQYREVHKVPVLDLVGVFMLGGKDGPNEVNQQFVRQVMDITGSDGIMLLLFQPEMVAELQGGKLPICLYESVKGQEGAGAEVEVKFRELSFEVETGEAEMIGVDFVATGAGIASAVPRAETTGPTPSASASTAVDPTKEKKTKGKGKAKDDDTVVNGISSTDILSPEDEELIASLAAKANAIKMLNQRLNLIRAYLQSQPPSYLTDATSTTLPPEAETNHTLLRSINAMLSRLPLLAPPTTQQQTTTTTTATTQSKEQADTHLTTLLASLTRSIYEAQSLGSKFNVYARDKAAKDRDRFGAGGPRSGGGGRLGFGEESGLLSQGPEDGF